MKKQDLTKRLNLMYILVLIPLILFGLYKNGIRLYQKDLVDLINAFKPLILLFMGSLGALVGSILRETDKDHKLSLETIKKCKSNIIEAILVVAILPLKSSPIIVFLTMFLFASCLNKLKINKMVLEYIVIEAMNVALGLNTFFNAYDMHTVLNYNGLDIFFGLGPGGIFATNIFLIILALIVLSFNKIYKKELVFASLATFLALGIIPNMILGHYSDIVPFIFGYNIIFILVFIAPSTSSTCYTIKGQITSGILIGLLTYGLYYLTPYTACVLAVLIVSLLKSIIDRIFVIK